MKKIKKIIFVWLSCILLAFTTLTGCSSLTERPVAKEHLMLIVSPDLLEPPLELTPIDKK